MMSRKVLTGSPAPLGATAGQHGTNFAVSSGGDEVTLCLFDADGTETQLVLPDRDGDVWHGFVPEVRAGQAYGFRVSGPFDPAQGLRYNSAKLLLDPYARARRRAAVRTRGVRTCRRQPLSTKPIGVRSIRAAEFGDTRRA